MNCVDILKYSIVVPVYNSKDYLDDCIKSIMHQTYCEWELILVDDGSSDGSHLVCDAYSKKDKRIKTFHKNNEGPFSARIYGVSKCTGQYCLFLDSDDTFYDDALESLLQYCKKDFDIIHFWYSKNKKRQDSDIVVPYLGENILEYKKVVLLNKVSSMPCKCIKTPIIQSIRAGERTYAGIFAEDLAYTLLIADNIKSAILIGKQLFDYRNNAKSTTHSVNFFNFSTLFDDNILFMQKKYCIKWFDNSNLFDNEIKEYWLSLCYILLVKSFQDENKQKNKKTPKSYFDVRFFKGFNDEMFREIKILRLNKKKKILLQAYFKKNVLLFRLFRLFYCSHYRATK